MKTKPLNHIFKIPLKSYSEYILDNVNRNAEIEPTVSDYILNSAERGKHYKEIGESYQKLKSIIKSKEIYLL